MLAEAEIKSAEPATPGKKSAKHVALKSAIAKMTEDVESARKELEGLRTNLTGRFAATVPKEGEDKPEAGKETEIISMPKADAEVLKRRMTRADVGCAAGFVHPRTRPV